MVEDSQARPSVLEVLNATFGAEEEEQRIESITEQMSTPQFGGINDRVIFALKRIIPGKFDIVQGTLFQVQITKRYINFENIAQAIAERKSNSEKEILAFLDRNQGS